MACGPPSGATDSHPLVVDAPEETPPSNSSPDGRPPTDRERAVIGRLASIAERARDLEFRERFDIKIQNREQILGHIFQELDEEELEVSRKVYVALGLLPADMDIQDLLNRVLGEQVAGYYDPEIDRLVIRDDVMRRLGGRTIGRTDEGAMTIVHELVHALQDQHFGLDDLEEEEDSDPSTAYQAVVEGDATLAMVGYAAQQNGMPLQLITQDPDNLRALLERGQAEAGNAELEAAPPILRVTLLSSYVDGLVFCAALHKDRGWAGIDEAHRRRPVSTEQILHPFKYLVGELPDRVEIPDGLIEGFAPLESDRLGELEMRVYFGQPQNDVNTAAAQGWNGDLMRAYESPDGRVAIVWFTSWDNPSEAEEAAGVAQTIADATPDPTQHLVLRRGRALLIVRGLTEDERRPAEGAFVAFADGLPERPTQRR